MFWGTVRGKALFDPSPERFEVWYERRSGHDHRNDRVAPRRVRHPTDGDVANGWEGLECALHRLGPYLLATGDNHVADPAGDGEHAVVVELAGVGGTKPSIA